MDLEKNKTKPKPNKKTPQKVKTGTKLFGYDNILLKNILQRYTGIAEEHQSEQTSTTSKQSNRHFQHCI